MKSGTFSEQNIIDIERAYDALIQSVSQTMTRDEIDYISRAFDLCREKYADTLMDSGRPLLLHCLDVAQIAYSELGMKSKTVVSALLHNITRYTDVTIDQIKEQFGDRVALILNDLEKVMALDMTHISTQSDTFRKLFLSIIDDIRVVMLVIAHSIDSCRHLDDVDDMTDNQGLVYRKRLSRFFDQLKYIVIPIVHRLGLYNIKKIFEESVMMYENPVEYQQIKEKISISRVRQEENMADFLKPVRKGLVEEGIDANIKWRTKSIPSIFAKMKAQDVPFEQVYDLFAVRIIINNSKEAGEKADCWKVYSIVTDLYQPNPKRLRDWITTPKASGYESLHTTVKYGDYWVEVQIRTQRMDDNAEKGTASHWLYKSGNDKRQTADEWLNQIREIMENADGQNDNNPLDDSRAKKGKTDKIFIITPQGDVKQLPVGSTILDFAFEVHTQVGSHCIGARVNGKMQPIRFELNNGDRVEIQTSKKQVPKADWLNYVTTEKSRSKIKRYLKDLEMKEAELGSAMFHRKLKNWKIVFNDKIFNELLSYYDCESGIEFYHKIATEQIDLADTKAYILTLIDDAKDAHQDKADDEAKKDKTVENKNDTINIGANIKGLAVKMAGCCNPIKGDDVFGFLSVAGALTIHRNDCSNAKALRKRYPYRVVDVDWMGGDSSRAALKITAKDNFGMLSDITDVMKQMEINILDANMKTQNGLYEGRFVVQISSVNLLEQLIRKLRDLHGVTDVQRIDL